MSQDVLRKELERLRKLQRKEENLAKLAEQDGFDADACVHYNKAYAFEQAANDLRSGRRDVREVRKPSCRKR